tara:strand:+ start:699 stop:1268 length:570 start_codon:yes stop_codon:yes gene_type:complete
MIKKKFLSLLFIFLFLAYTPVLKAKDGFGEVTLSKQALNALTQYFTDTLGTPGYFALSSSGKYYHWSYCPRQYAGMCVLDDWPVIQSVCKKWAKENNSDERCYIFAKKRKIVWNNSSNNNFIKIRRKITEEDLHKILYANKFLIEDYAVPTYDTDNPDIIEKIKGLKKLYDQGALTKDDFEKAKKKLLN